MKKVVGLLVMLASGLIKLHAQHVQVGILEGSAPPRLAILLQFKI